MPSKSERRRAQLLQLGVELFTNKPYDEVVVEDVAAAAGISKGLLYHYFGNKKAFYLSCVQSVATQLFGDLQTIDTENPALAVEEGLRRFLDYLDVHGKVYQALLTGAAGGELSIRQMFEQTRQLIASLILSSVGVDPTHPIYRSTARSWVGAVESAALDRLAHGDPDREAFISMQSMALADRLLHAHHLAPNASSPRLLEAARAGRDHLLSG